MLHSLCANDWLLYHHADLSLYRADEKCDMSLSRTLSIPEHHQKRLLLRRYTSYSAGLRCIMVFVGQPSLSQYTHDDVLLLGVPTSYDNDTAFKIANPIPNNDLDEDPQWRALGVRRLFRLQMEAFPFSEGTGIIT